MSSPNKSIGEGDDASGDDNKISAIREPDSPHSKDDPSSELSDTLEAESSDDEQNIERQSKKSFSQEAQKRGSSFISDEESDLDEDSPCTPKRAKKVVFSRRQKRDSTSLECGASGNDPIEDLAIKKAKTVPTMPADSTVTSPATEPNPEGSPSTPPKTSHSPEKLTGKYKVGSPTPILKGLLGSSTPSMSSIGEAPASRVQSSASITQSATRRSPETRSSGSQTESSSSLTRSSGSQTRSRDISARTPHSTLLVITGSPPVRPLSTDPFSLGNPYYLESRPIASEGQEESPLLRSLLSEGQSSSDTQGTAGLNTPPQASGPPSDSPPQPSGHSSVSESMSGLLLTDPQDDSSDENGVDEDNSEESCSQSSTNVSPEQKTKPDLIRDGKSLEAEHDTEVLHGSLSQSSDASPELVAEESMMASKDEQVADENLSSQPPTSSPSAISTRDSGVIEQLSDQLSNTSSEPGMNTDDSKACGQAENAESKLISSRQLSDDASDSSMDIDERISSSLLSEKQSSSDTEATDGLNNPPQASGPPSDSPPQPSRHSSVSESMSGLLLSDPQNEKSDMQDDSSDENGVDEDNNSEESCSQSSANVSPEQKTKPDSIRDGKSLEAEHDTEVLHSSQSDESPELVAEPSMMASKDEKVADENLSSQPPTSSPSAISTRDSGVIEQLSAQLSNTSSEPGRNTDDSNACGQAENAESKLISSRQLSEDASEPESESSMDIDERVSSNSPLPPSNNSTPASVFSDSPAETLGTESGDSSQPTLNISPESSEVSQGDNLVGMKLEDSSLNTPGRKTKRLQEAKESSGDENTSSASEEKVVDPEDEHFKKPVTDVRMQKIKSRLGDLSLGDASVTNSPTRRSARIQSKEGGASSKDLTSLEKEGKSMQPKPGGRATSDERRKEGEKPKSLSRERVAKLKSERSASRSESRERAETKEINIPQTRSREGTSTGSRERISSGENVAGRTRSTKSRVASTSSNSEADKTEEDEKETCKGKRKSRKDSSK